MTRPATFLALVPFLASLPACNTPPKEAHDGAIVNAPVASASASPVASASASPVASAPPVASAFAPPPASTPGACTKDDDCRLFSSYCQEAPCACRALGSRDPSPRCLGAAASNVRCFVDPCMKKAAQCQSGACVVTAK